MCESFYDGTLAHTGFADENGVVFLSAAEYLDDALNLLLASHNGIEFSVGCSLSKVGGEVVEHGSLTASMLCLRLSGLFCITRTAPFSSSLVAALCLLVVFAWQVKTVLVGWSLQVRHYVFVGYIVEFQHLFGAVVHLIVQNGHEQMLYIHGLRMLHARFEDSQFENVAGFLVQYKLTRVEGLVGVVFTHALFKLFLDGLLVYLHTVEQSSDDAVLLADDTQ